jgi:hypothetical protein
MAALCSWKQNSLSAGVAGRSVTGSCRGLFGTLGQDAVTEGGPSADEGDQLRGVHGAPAVPGWFDELECHRRACGP